MTLTCGGPGCLLEGLAVLSLSASVGGCFQVGRRRPGQQAVGFPTFFSSGLDWTHTAGMVSFSVLRAAFIGLLRLVKMAPNDAAPEVLRLMPDSLVLSRDRLGSCSTDSEMPPRPRNRRKNKARFDRSSWSYPPATGSDSSDPEMPVLIPVGLFCFLLRSTSGAFIHAGFARLHAGIRAIPGRHLSMQRLLDCMRVLERWSRWHVRPQFYSVPSGGDLMTLQNWYRIWTVQFPAKT